MSARRASVLTWDRRIDVERLSDMVEALGNHVHIYDVGDTGSDDYALVVATAPLTTAEVHEAFEWWWAGCGEADDRLDTFDWPPVESSGSSTGAAS